MEIGFIIIRLPTIFISYCIKRPYLICSIHSLKVNWPFLHDDGWQNKFFFPSYISFVFWESLIWLWLVVVNMRHKWPFVKTEVNFATGEESTMTFCLLRLGFESFSDSFYFLIWCQLFYASLMTFACYTFSFSELVCWWEDSWYVWDCNFCFFYVFL